MNNFTTCSKFVCLVLFLSLFSVSGYAFFAPVSDRTSLTDINSTLYPVEAPIDSYTLLTTNVGSTSAQLAWSGTAAAPYEVRWRKQGDPLWITTSDITLPKFGLTDLENGQTYEWQMRPAGSTVWFGDPVVFTTTYGCSAPYLSTPYNVSVTSAYLSWNAYSNLPAPYPTYTLEIKTSEATSWSSVSNIPNPYNGSVYYTMQNLTPGTTYAWRVRSACSPFSTTDTFETPACTINNPRQEPLPTSARLRWSITPGATYQVQWRPQGGNWSRIDGILPSPYTSTVESSLTGLTPNTAYEWQARAVCGATPGAYSPLFSFSAACNQPTSVSLVSTNSTDISIGWRSVYKAADYGYSYVLQHRPQSPSNAPWTTTYYAYNSPYNQPFDFVGSVSGLTPESGYEVRVQTMCPNSLTSVYTDPPISATTSSCTGTAGYLYTSGVGFNRAYLSWSPASYNYHSAVQFRPIGSNSWSQVGPTASTSSTLLTGLQAGTPYEWRVISYCTSSVSAVTPSSSQTFTTAVCSLTGIYGLVVTSVDYASATVGWYERSPAAETYLVRHRPAGSSTYTVLPLQTSNTISLTGLQENTMYEWEVSPVCSASPTTYSFTAPQTLTTSCQNRAAGLSTSNRTGTSVTLSWYNYNANYSTNYTYSIRYRTSSEASWQLIPLTSSNYSMVTSLSGLQPNTTYEWGVAMQCTPGSSSTYTSGTSFTTACRYTMSGLSTQHITPVKASINFYDSEYHSQYQIRYRIIGSPNWNLITSYSSYVSLTGLTPYSAYEWQVAGVCAPNLVSDFSPSQTFNSDCFVPTELNASVNGSTVNFYWTANQNVAGYTLQYRLQGTTSWTSLAVVGTSGSTSVNGLKGSYEWRLSTACGGGLNSDFSAIQTVSTPCNIPYAVAITANGSYASAIRWNPDNGTGTRYTLQWRPTRNPAWNTVTDLPQNAHVLTGLIDNTSYEVRVQAQCGNLQSGYSSVESFGAVCSPPTGLASPGFYSYESEPYRDFSWSVTAGMSYNLRWRTVSASNEPLSDWQTAYNVTPSTRQFQYTAGIYEWQVQGVCVNGSQSAFVGGKPFVVNDCETGYIQYRSIAEATTATLLYSAFVHADLRWRPVGAADWNTVLNLSVQSGLTLRGLTENTPYEWQVRVHCLSGQTADFGPLQSFTTSCGPPAGLFASCIDPNQARLNWGNAPATNLSGQYEVNWRAVGASAWASTGVTGNTFSLTGLATSTNYEWRVRSVCSASATAAFSAPAAFYTQCSQPTALTLGYLSCSSAFLSWSGGCQSGSVVRYRYDYGAWTDYYTPYSGYSFSNVPSGAFVEVQVRSSCSDGSISAFSNIYSFRAPTCAVVNACGVPSGLTVRDLAADQVTLSWQTANTTSELRWRMVGGNWNSTPVSGSSYLLTGLSNNTLYEWQVRSTCGGLNDYSVVSFVKTRCDETFWITTLKGELDRIQIFINKPTTFEVRYRTGGGAWTTQALSGNTPVINGLTPNTRYELQFRNSCIGGAYSNWLPSRFVRTGCLEPTILYTDDVTPVSAACTWTTPFINNANWTLQYRPKGSADWTTIGNLAPASGRNVISYTLTGLNQQMTYEWQVFTNCSGGANSVTANLPLTFRTTGTAPFCAGMVTIQNGDWTNPAVWSCNRVPLLTDPVQIRHAVMIPDRGTGQALRINVDAGGSVRYGTGARLLLGQ